MKKLKVVRSAEHKRLCRRCCRAVVETELSKQWTCRECVKNGVAAVMPVLAIGSWEKYDTSKVFAGRGYRVWKSKQGDGPEHMDEARSPDGVFYAAGEACVAFETKRAKTKLANALLREFPQVRRVSCGDDGVNVIHVPVDIFDAFATRVGAYKKRVLTPQQKEALAKAREKSPIGRTYRIAV